MNYRTIDKDDNERGNWKSAKAVINKKDNTLHFSFPMDFYNSDDYMLTNVIYKGKNIVQ